jgi:hypothetical protein
VNPVTTYDDDYPPAVETAVTQWVADVDELLGRLQLAIKLLGLDGAASPDVKQVMNDLLELVRELRVDAPSPQEVRLWLRALACVVGVNRLRGPARFINAPEPPIPSPTGA